MHAWMYGFRPRRTQARLYLEDCREWARILRMATDYCGNQLLDESQSSAQVLGFANGVKIFCCSSNPNALAGKRGHVKLDEFALQPRPTLLYAAKPGPLGRDALGYLDP